MNVETLAISIGEQTICHDSCKIGLQCYGGWINEYPVCDNEIERLKKLCEDAGFEVLLMSSRGLLFRIFDLNSPVRPKTKIGDITIENGLIKLGV